MKTIKYRVRVNDITMASDLEYYCMSSNIEYERDGRIFIISDAEFVGKLNRDLCTVTIVDDEEKEPIRTLYTKEEIIKAIESDLEALIFSYEQQLKEMEENLYVDLPSWRRDEYLHMRRASKFVEKLKTVI